MYLLTLSLITLFINFTVLKNIPSDNISGVYLFNYLNTLNKYLYLFIPAIIIEYYLFKNFFNSIENNANETNNKRNSVYLKNYFFTILFINSLSFFISSLLVIFTEFLNISTLLGIFVFHIIIYSLIKFFIYFRNNLLKKVTVFSFLNMPFIISLFVVNFYFYEQNKLNSYDYQKNVNMKASMMEFQTIIEEYNNSQNTYPQNISELKNAIKNNQIFYKKNWLINDISPCNKKTNLFRNEVKYYFFKQIFLPSISDNNNILPCSIKYELKNNIYKISAYNEYSKPVIENNSEMILSNNYESRKK